MRCRLSDMGEGFTDRGTVVVYTLLYDVYIFFCFLKENSFPKKKIEFLFWRAQEGN